MMSREKHLYGIERPVAAVVLLVLVSGCGGRGDGDPAVVGGGDARVMIDMYSAYLREHRNRPPPDEQAFRAYLETKQDRLQQAGMTVDQMFVSPRSSDPLQWVYGNRLPTDERGTAYLGYETTPVNSKRLVFASRGTTEMEETRFRQVFPNAP